MQGARALCREGQSAVLRLHAQHKRLRCQRDEEKEEDCSLLVHIGLRKSVREKPV